MSENKKLTPKIRFKGFTEDWEQRKLSKLITEYKETVDSDCALPVLTSSKSEGVIFQEEHFGRKQNHDITGYNILPRDYCTYRNRSDGVDFTFNINKCCDKGIISKFYPVFCGRENDTFFISLVLNNSEEVIKEIGYTCTGTGQKVLSFLDLLKMNLTVPSYDEQRKITICFETIDNLITLHQRKYDKLVKIKSSLLEKMFPKNSSKIPEVRFKGFTEDWEQRKLDKYLEQYTEVTKTNNQYPALTSSRKGIFFQTEYFAGNQIASENNIGYNIVPRNYFTYRHMSDDEIFHFNINDICDFGIVSTLYPVFTTKNNMDSKYLQYQLNYGKEFYNYSILQKQGGSRTYMYFAKLKELYLTIPSYKEQCKISSILSEIDNLITLHQRKLDKLQNIKKSLLDKMFV